MVLVATGSTVVPAILTLKQLGYTIKINIENGSQVVTAKKDKHLFSADDPVTVLGLIKMFEIRGEEWMASDEEIASVGHEYHLFE